MSLEAFTVGELEGAETEEIEGWPEGSTMHSPRPHVSKPCRRRMRKTVALPNNRTDRTGRPIRVGYLRVKVVAEWILAAAMLIAAAPIVAILALSVKLTSRGPAFYRQTRLGLHGRRYSIIKLRTMAHNCEATTGAVWATQDDPRVTSFGRWLRTTHLDEIPQLWNVVKGEMGLIGPRPERPEIAAELERVLSGYGDRHKVRPGITGLAQMLLPADSDLEGVRKKLSHDLYYVREVSFWMDFRIAVCTASHFTAVAAVAVCSRLITAYGRAVMQEFEKPASAPTTLDDANVETDAMLAV